MIREILAEYPQSRVHLSKMRQLFDDYDVDRSAYLELEEIEVGSDLTMSTNHRNQLTMFAVFAECREC